MDGNPLLVANNDSTKQGTHADIELIKTRDDFITYSECGWFCVTGWKNDRRIVHAHFHSEEEYRRMVNPRSFKADAGRRTRRYRLNPDIDIYPAD